MTPTLSRPPRPTPRDAGPRPDGLALVVRVVLIAAVVGAAGYFAFFLAFGALVTFTGCFLSCTDDGNALGGIALAVGAAAALACAPLAVAAAFRSRVWARAAGAVFVLASVLGVGALLLS